MVNIILSIALVTAILSGLMYITFRALRRKSRVDDTSVADGAELAAKPGTFLGFTKSDWADAGRWMRHQFASWFSSSFVLMCMFILIIAGIVIGMRFDGAYAERWAPAPDEEAWFRAYGWLVSLAMVILTSAGVLAFRKGAWFSGLVATTGGLYFLLLSVSQSIGFVTLKAEEMTRTAQSYDAAIDAEALTTSELITELEGQRDALNTLVEQRTGELTGEIGQYITDGRNNDELADDSRDRRTDEQRRQDNELAALNARILCLKGDDSECTAAEITAQAAAPVLVEPRRYDPVVRVLAFMRHGHNATDEQLDSITINYLFFWSIGAPLIGLMLSVFLMITRHPEREKKDKRPSPWKSWGEKTWWQRFKFWKQIPRDEDDGLIHESYTQEEWEWLQKAREHRTNYERGQDLKSRIPIENTGYLKQRKLDIIGHHEAGLSAEEIAESLGMTLPEFTEWVQKFFKPHMAGRILGDGPVDARNGGLNDASPIQADT